MTTLYRTRVTVQGGRSGRTQSEDGHLDVELSVPRALGGAGGAGTNPEQLLAAGYAACFESALRVVLREKKVAVPDGTTVSAEVALGRRPDGLFAFDIALTGKLPGIAREEALALMEAAHQVCPFSNMTRGQLSLSLQVAAPTPLATSAAA